MNEVEEIKELLSGISSSNIEDIIRNNQKDKLSFYKKKCKQYYKYSARGGYFNTKYFETKYEADIICKWTEEDVRKFAEDGSYGTSKYGLMVSDVENYIGEIPEKVENLIEKLERHTEDYPGRLKIIADSKHLRPNTDPYLTYKLNGIYYLMAKWGKDIEIVEKEHKPIVRKWFG